MALFKCFFNRKQPNPLHKISERVYVFNSCFSSEVLEEDEYKIYMRGIVAQLHDYYPDSSFEVFNFRDGDKRTQFSEILSEYDMTVAEFPLQYNGCSILTLDVIHHYLRFSDGWLSLGKHNVLLMHCERGGWSMLAFMLAALLLYRKQYKTLEMVYRQGPRELLHLGRPLNIQPSQLRYLDYISRRNLVSDWPPSDTPLTLDCIILQSLLVYGNRPVVRIYGKDYSSTSGNRRSKLLFESSNTKKLTDYHQPEDYVKIDIHLCIQGDVILECVHMDEVNEEMNFRVAFHTTFVQANVLMFSRDEIDVMWDARDKYSENFKAEVLFSDADALPSMITTEREFEDGDGTEILMPVEFFETEEILINKVDEHPPPPPIHASPSPPPLPPPPPPPPPNSALSKLETPFSAIVPKQDSSRGGGRLKVTGSKTEKAHTLLVSDVDAKGQEESQKFWDKFWEKVDATTFIE